ncbi:hypothetical protein N656DRAFT_783665 [Canariomyces notabilis]|uniref:Uncharacterized protein n=1 Tax=Canariomyces notabilis TaxID=2074819 RepID=A0AAN6T8D2_9PEZI|nr:hypothetical protein N656DRAFT_783665 [Canariomyces arenarius]
MPTFHIFDPVVALRAAPLVSSTCTLLYAWDQDFFLGLLNRPENHRARSRALLPPYFRTFFRRGVGFVVGCLAVTTWSSVANLYVRRPALHARQSFWWYVAGAALSSGHLLFVPVIAPSIKAIWDADAGKPETAEGTNGAGIDANAALDEWLVINKIRSLTVDLAAWVTCVVAVTRTLEA